MTKLKARELTRMQMEHTTKVSGLTTNSMAKVLRAGLMVLDMKVNTSKGKKKAKGG